MSDQDKEIRPRSHSSLLRSGVTLGIAIFALSSALAGVGEVDLHRRWLFGWHAPAGLPSGAHVVAVLALLALTPQLWRGIRTAAWLALGGLAVLTVADLADGRYVALTAALVLAAGLGTGLWRGAFVLGCRNRPHPAVLAAALSAWGCVSAAVIASPLTGQSDRVGVDHRLVSHVLSSSAARLDLNGDWRTLIELMILGAAAISALALRSLLRAAPGGQGHRPHDRVVAREIIDRHGHDSLSPFVVRPDKALCFARGGVLAFRVIGETAIVSSDPVAPGADAPLVMEQFLSIAHERGWQVVLWGASARHLDAYRTLGMRQIRVGEEAFVNPAQFTLKGRGVRKLRQSVNRVQRRGWEIEAYRGRALDAELESEVDAVECRWRAEQPGLLGFAMGMGSFEPELRLDDLYVVARSPSGELCAVMRFASHCGKLSLDTMRRVGETPNGLNEALICRALELARSEQIPEVSLNYAGLAHLVRGQATRNAAGRVLTRAGIGLLSRRFQLDRLVQFNEKFSPEWRPRYLVYESRIALPRTIVRVLQAEGYLPGGDGRPRRLRLPAPSTIAGSAHANRAG